MKAYIWSTNDGDASSWTVNECQEHWQLGTKPASGKVANSSSSSSYHNVY